MLVQPGLRALEYAAGETISQGLNITRVSQFDSGITRCRSTAGGFTAPLFWRRVRCHGAGDVEDRANLQAKISGHRRKKKPPGLAPEGHPVLRENLFLQSRWYVHERGEQFYPDAPRLIDPHIKGRTAAR